MRLLFISLILLNVSVGGWQLMVRYAGSMPDLPEPRSFARVLQPDTITLLNEAEQIISRGDSVFESVQVSQSSMSAKHTGLAPKSESKASLAEAATSTETPMSTEAPMPTEAPVSKIALTKAPAPKDVLISKDSAPKDLVAVEAGAVELLARSDEIEGVSKAKPLGKACQMLGPFKSRGSADSSLGSLFAGSAVGAHVENQRAKAKDLYWVYLRPQSDRKSARVLLADMKSRDIDSYIIVKGELRNGVSLGMYSNKKFALARFKKVAALGYKPKIQSVDRSKDQYWVVFDAQKVSSKRYASISSFLKKRSDLKIKENFCGLDIASQSNIQ